MQVPPPDSASTATPPVDAAARSESVDKPNGDPAILSDGQGLTAVALRIAATITPGASVTVDTTGPALAAAPDITPPVELVEPEARSGTLVDAVIARSAPTEPPLDDALPPIDLAILDTSPQPALTEPAPRRRRHFLGLRALIALVILLPFAFALIVAIGLIGQEVTAPSWLKTQIEDQAAEVLDGGTLRFGRITLTVGSDLHPRVRMSETVLRDAGGNVLARVPMIEALLSPRGLILRREVLPQEITLTGAEIALERARDGTVALAFGGGDATAGRATSLAGVLEQFDSIFERPALAALELVRANGLIVNYQDARAGRGWTVDGGTLSLDLRGDVTRLNGDLTLLSGRSYVTTLQLAYESPRGSPAAEIALTVIDAASDDIASQSPALSWLSVIDAPLSASLRGTLDARGALSVFRASLKMGQGALAPTPGTEPVRFEYARADLTFVPGESEIMFERVSVLSDWGGVKAEGRAYLREVTEGWPGALLGQFTFSDISLNPGGMYAEPLTFAQGIVDLRLRLEPFALTLGQFVLSDVAGAGQAPLIGRAEIGAGSAGWIVAVDASLDAISPDRVMALWPANLIPGTRNWFAANLSGGRLFNISGGMRWTSGHPVQLAVSQEFESLTVRPMLRLPPITGAAGYATYLDGALSLVLDAGQIAPPTGGMIDLAGSVLSIPDINVVGPPASITLTTNSSITAALSLIDLPPFGYLTAADLPVTLTDGRAQVTMQIDLPLRNIIPADEVIFDVTARLSDVRSTVLLPGRTLAAAALTLRADPDGMTIGGPVRIGQVAADLDWQQAFDGGGSSSIDGTIELSQRFVEEFGIGLPPDTVRGEAQADVRLTLPRNAAPTFRLESGLGGLGLSLPALGWSKGPGDNGSLIVEGTLGDVPDIARLSLDAAGLIADGRISLTGAGALDVARFDRVQLGGWLDAPVSLIGRGAGRALGVEIGGGALDLRRADFGSSPGDGGPMSLALDRLQVTDGIALTSFRGEFDAANGFDGSFTANVNGGAPVSGSTIAQGGRVAVRVIGDDAGAVLASAGFLQNARGGAMDLTLLPAGGEGSYDGTLSIANLRVRDAPALASLLNAISVVGLLQQMGGQGLVFDEVTAEFRIAPDRITVLRSSAIGAGLGISLDGIYTTADRGMDFQGVISPFYLLNGIGSILTRPGEGLIGFNFNLQGVLGDPRVLVNPFSVLTPGMFREIFRRPPPVVE